LQALVSAPFVGETAIDPPHPSIGFLVDQCARDEVAVSGKPVERFLSILATHQERQMEWTKMAREKGRGKKKKGGSLEGDRLSRA